MKTIRYKSLFIVILSLFFGWQPADLKAVEQNAFFYVLPETKSHEPGEIFPMDILINVKGVSINAAQAVIFFPADKLKVIKISKEGSIFSLWVQEPVFSNSKGEISFGGGLPSPGYLGESGKIMTIFFQVEREGQAQISFGNEFIPANNSSGTNVFSPSQPESSENSGEYFNVFSYKALGLKDDSLKIPEIHSPTHPQENKWYSDNNPKFQWENARDVIGVSAAFNKIPFFNPSLISQGLFNSKNFKDIEDGVWYFHLRVQSKNGWSATSRFKIQIDSQPPRPFEITVDNGGDLTDPQPFLYFETEDELSGIDRYDIKIGNEDNFSVFGAQANPFRLPFQSPGIYPVVVKAVDMAGNYIQNNAALKIDSIDSPEITVCPNDYVSGQEILHIEGTGLPGQKTIVFLENNQGLVKFWDILNNEKGEWYLNKNDLLKSGSYRISAQEKNEKGAVSSLSNKCNLKVVLSGISIGSWIINYKSLIWLLIIVLFLVLILVLYLFIKYRKNKKDLKRETEDLKQKIYKEYGELEKGLMEELNIIKNKMEISEKDREREKELVNNLEDIKKVFDKEIKDIEDRI